MLTLRQPVVFANSNQDPGNYNERTDARARAVSTLSAADSQATVSAAETISREPTPTPPARRINTAGEDYEATESQDGDMEDGGEFGEETDGIVVDEEVCGRGGRGQGRSNPPEAAGSRQDHWKEKVEREGQG
ncbi:hypothetical protein A1F97_09638 [Pyrenophora tritici-repentis]|nr:hypothetical protein A1F97_09638 [Pyrenophora tritici-repentis]